MTSRRRLGLLLTALLLVPGCGSRAHEPTVQGARPSATTETPITTATLASPSPSPSPSTSTSTPTPSPTATTEPAGPPESATTRTGVSTLTVHLDHGRAPAADLLHLRVEVASESGRLRSLTICYGDGQRFDERGPAISCPSPGPTPAPARSSYESRDLLVSYRVPGSYLIDLHATTDSPCAPGPREQLHTALRVVITPGRSLTNGRQLPGDAQVVPTTTHDVLAAFAPIDPDGWISAYRWDFGDGSRPVTDRMDPTTCRDPGTTWPHAEGDGGTSRVRHHYARPGHHTVKVTVITSGCSGADVQRVTSRTVVDA